MTERRDVVVGGGISGLLAALVLTEKLGRRVVVVEREATLGGLLRSFDYGPQGRFDYGMHTMFDTGISDLDTLLYGLLPEDEWQIGEGNRRDLAGLYYRGAVQTNSPYIDLRRLPAAEYRQCVSDFFVNLTNGSLPGTSNARSYAMWRFGHATAQLVASAIEKIYGRDAALMDIMATMITPFDRVVMFGEHAFIDLMKSDVLRARLAFPEQRNLPPERASGRRTYYPRRYGIERVIEAMALRLQAAGAEVKRSCDVRGLSIENGCITSIETSDQSIPVSHVYWTSGLPALARVAGVPLPAGHFDPPRRTVIVNVLVDAPIRHDLHYFYCYEAGFRTFRLTNFTAYCEGAPRNGQYPITLELLVDDADVKDLARLQETALEELEKFDVLQPGSTVTFVRVEPLAAGFPMPSTKAIGGMTLLRDALAERQLKNLTIMGVLSEPNLFFQRDVLADAYRKVNREL